SGPRRWRGRRGPPRRRSRGDRVDQGRGARRTFAGGGNIGTGGDRDAHSSSWIRLGFAEQPQVRLGYTQRVRHSFERDAGGVDATVDDRGRAGREQGRVY